MNLASTFILLIFPLMKNLNASDTKEISFYFDKEINNFAVNIEGRKIISMLIYVEHRGFWRKKSKVIYSLLDDGSLIYNKILNKDTKDVKDKNDYKRTILNKNIVDNMINEMRKCGIHHKKIEDRLHKPRHSNCYILEFVDHEKKKRHRLFFKPKASDNIILKSKGLIENNESFISEDMDLNFEIIGIV